MVSSRWLPVTGYRLPVTVTGYRLLVTGCWLPVAGGAGTSDLGFLSVDEPGVPYSRFTPRASGD